MKILLDEQMTEASCVRYFPADAEVSSVKTLGLVETRNGDLLRMPVVRSFDAFVTLDQEIKFQQNLGALPFALIDIKVRRREWDTMRGWKLRAVGRVIGTEVNHWLLQGVKNDLYVCGEPLLDESKREMLARKLLNDGGDMHCSHYREYYEELFLKIRRETLRGKGGDGGREP